MARTVLVKLTEGMFNSPYWWPD